MWLGPGRSHPINRGVPAASGIDTAKRSITCPLTPGYRCARATRSTRRLRTQDKAAGRRVTARSPLSSLDFLPRTTGNLKATAPLTAGPKALRPEGSLPLASLLLDVILFLALRTSVQTVYPGAIAAYDLGLLLLSTIREYLINDLTATREG